MKEFGKSEIINDLFVLVLSQHLFCFTDYVNSLDLMFNLGCSYAIIVAILIVINLVKILSKMMETFIKAI